MGFRIEQLSGRSALRDWRCEGREATEPVLKELLIITLIKLNKFITLCRLCLNVICVMLSLVWKLYLSVKPCKTLSVLADLSSEDSFPHNL